MKALVAIAVLAASAPLAAASVVTQDAAQNPDDRMICRHIRTRKSGTRIGSARVCHSAAEWRRIQEHGTGMAELSTMFHDTREVAGRHSRPN